MSTEGEALSPREVLVWGLARRLARGEAPEQVRKLVEGLPKTRVASLMGEARELAETDDMMAVEGLLAELDSDDQTGGRP